jgi:CRP-like cAMP-binding protein
MGSRLTGLGIFRQINESQMKLLEPLFELYTCQPGTVVLRQGELADYLYCVVSGAVEISYKPYDGNAITVTHVEKGGLFGWSAVVGSEKYTSSAVAIEVLEAMRIRGGDLRKFCVDHPEAGKEILEHLASAVSSRWKDANKQVKSILSNGMKDQK